MGDKEGAPAQSFLTSLCMRTTGKARWNTDPQAPPEILIQQFGKGAAEFAFPIIFQMILVSPVRMKDHTLRSLTEAWEIRLVLGRKAEWVGTDEGEQVGMVAKT